MKMLGHYLIRRLKLEKKRRRKHVIWNGKSITIAQALKNAQRLEAGDMVNATLAKLSGAELSRFST
ncbi:hypothetical protein KKB83_04660 [Patescibacteria group bacterium]|nr:hypothetical protein [Patescibacteria group bacterium]